MDSCTGCKLLVKLGTARELSGAGATTRVVFYPKYTFHTKLTAAYCRHQWGRGTTLMSCQSIAGLHKDKLVTLIPANLESLLSFELYYNDLTEANKGNYQALNAIN